MPKYTSKQEIENYLLIDIIESFESQVDTWIDNVERYIDDYTGRNFVADSAASARLYNGNGKNEIDVDDCIAITLLEVGNGFYAESYITIGNTGYVTLPGNAIAQGIPIKAIHLKNQLFTVGLQNIRVTAKWGYSQACPGDIKMVATLLTAHLYKFGRGGITSGASQERIGNYTIVYQDRNAQEEYKSAMMVLDKYKRLYL